MKSPDFEKCSQLAQALLSLRGSPLDFTFEQSKIGQVNLWREGPCQCVSESPPLEILWGTWRNRYHRPPNVPKDVDVQRYKPIRHHLFKLRQRLDGKS